MMASRQIGGSQVAASPVAMGCWPMAGITNLNAVESESVATLRAALERGVTHFDTAHCYGYDGESERLIGRTLGGRRSEFSLATKCGVAYDSNRVRVTDGRPESLRRQVAETLQRLGFDVVDLLYLHAPDPAVPLVESAGELREIQARGTARAIGLCNATIAQIAEFQAVCPLAAVQLKYNLLQRDIEADVVPWCRRHGVSLMVYWPLMKGLLAGTIRRDHVFDPRDPRLQYPIFQRPEWDRHHDFIATLGEIAARLGRTVAQVTVNWTIHRPGITAALCGATRPTQIEDCAAAMHWELDEQALSEIEAAYQRWSAATHRLEPSPGA